MSSDPVGTIRRHPDGDRFAIRTYAVFADAPRGYTTWTHVSIAGVASTPHTPLGDYYDSWPIVYRPPAANALSALLGAEEILEVLSQRGTRGVEQDCDAGRIHTVLNNIRAALRGLT